MESPVLREEHKSFKSLEWKQEKAWNVTQEADIVRTLLDINW